VFRNARTYSRRPDHSHTVGKLKSAK